MRYKFQQLKCRCITVDDQGDIWVCLCIYRRRPKDARSWLGGELLGLRFLDQKASWLSKHTIGQPRAALAYYEFGIFKSCRTTICHPFQRAFCKKAGPLVKALSAWSAHSVRTISTMVVLPSIRSKPRPPPSPIQHMTIHSQDSAPRCECSAPSGSKS